jgi:hypothetical protein
VSSDLLLQFCETTIMYENMIKKMKRVNFVTGP